MINSKTEIAPADVARHYDELDSFYREIWGEHVHHGLWVRGDETQEVAVRQLAELVAAEAGVEQGKRVIDIGCGYGGTARLLVERYGAEVTGITISAAQHAVALRSNEAGVPRPDDSSKAPANSPGAESGSGTEREGLANPHFVLGDWLHNDLPDAAFDCAIAIESSEHMPDKSAFFAQAQRVLRPGGRLVICAWLAAERVSPRQERWLVEPICREGRMPHLGNVAEYRRLAEAAGFQIEKTHDVTRQIERTWPKIAGIFLLNLLRKPSYIRFLFNRHATNRIFALTIFRLWLAFRTNAMCYVVFTLRKTP